MSRLSLGCALYSKTNPARIDVVSVEKKRTENGPFSHFFGDHDNRFRDGQFAKNRKKKRERAEGKINVHVNWKAYPQRTVSTRGSMLLLLPRSGWAGAEK